MNTQAKLGLTIGVLTGIGNQHDLSDADVLVLDVNECVDMVLPNERQGQYNYQEDAGSNPSTKRFFLCVISLSRSVTWVVNRDGI